MISVKTENSYFAARPGLGVKPLEVCISTRAA